MAIDVAFAIGIAVHDLVFGEPQPFEHTSVTAPVCPHCGKTPW